MENLYGKPHAVLCGGGHVSLALAKVLELMDFRITVVDDRAEFANRERFPRAAVYCQDFASCLEEKEFGPNTYYIIVTRGHQADYTCLKRILRKPSAYVGMIGSGRKVALAFQRLRADGFSEEEMKRVHAPVGLSIGAQTPAEIAVSIAAEIIQEKNRCQRNILEEAVAEGIRSPQEGCWYPSSRSTVLHPEEPEPVWSLVKTGVSMGLSAGVVWNSLLQKGQKG